MVDYITPAKGKIDLVDTPIDSMETKTLKLTTGVNSQIIAIDVDAPYSEENKRLLQYISKNDLISYSSQYTLDDVFAGKCRYKVMYRYKSDKPLSNPRTKKDDNGNKIPQPVEIFYSKKKKVAVIGERHDGYKYILTGELTDLHFDLQDVVSYKIKTRITNKKQGNAKVKRKKQEDIILKDLPDDLEEVDSKEFSQIITRINGDSPSIIKKNKNLLVFPCLFPEEHTKQNNAYAFKKGGHYVAKCQGLVCDHQYQNLNRIIKEDYVNSVDFDFEGFEINDDHKVNLFIAPTSYGKTERIAQEVLNAITQNRKLLVVCQSIEAIERLKHRINYYSKGAMPTLEMSGKIYTWIAENNNGDLENSFIKSNVILTHHYYLSNAGDVLTFYPALSQILTLPNLEMIVDEAHTWLELVTQLSIESGGVYKQVSRGRYIENKHKLIKDTFDRHLEQDKLKEITKCLEPTLTDYGTIELRKQYKVYDVVDYIDLISEIEKRFEPKLDYKEDNSTLYKLYKNPNPKQIHANRLEDCEDALNLILDPSEYIIISKLLGDDVPRKTIGRTIANIYHYGLLKLILNSMSRVILTTATFTDYHYNCLDRSCKYNEIKIDNKLKKVDRVVLLTRNKDTQRTIRHQIMDNLNETNARALLFMPTINNAKTMANKYDNFILNDNGWYSIANRVSQDDYIDNFKRNAIVCGLESSVAKGYNFMEEVGENAEGFDVVYFDSEPVSPDVLKKYVGLNERIEDYYDTYAMTTFTQAIGRALRKEKKQMTICLNNISEKLTEAIIKYLDITLGCEIVRDSLSLTNLKVSTLKDMEDMEDDIDLSNNKLYKKLYLEKGKGINE